MQKVNINEIQERKRQSPNGKFARASKDVSIALDDLGASSGWPILGVVGAPRAKRGWLRRLGR